MPPFTSEGIYPASHRARSRTQPRFPPSTRAQGGKEQLHQQLHHPLLPAMTWTSSPWEEQVLTNFRRNVHLWVFQWNTNRGCTNAMLCSAGNRTLSSGAVALLNVQHKGQGPEQAKGCSSSLLVPKTFTPHLQTRMMPHNEVGRTRFSLQGHRLITQHQLIAFCQLNPQHITHEIKIPPYTQGIAWGWVPREPSAS